MVCVCVCGGVWYMRMVCVCVCVCMYLAQGRDFDAEVHGGERDGDEETRLVCPAGDDVAAQECIAIG